MPSLILLLASSCVWYAPGESDDTGRPGGSDPDDDCDVVLVDVRPAPGATGISTSTDIVAAFSRSDEEARVYLHDADGRAISGETSRADGGATLIFRPSSTLRAATDYQTTVSWCGGQAPFDFRTGGGEPPVEDERIGRSYRFDLTQGRVVSPEGVGDLFLALVERPAWLQVLGADPDLRLRLANGTPDGGQEACMVTNDLVTTDEFRPTFSARLDAMRIGAPDVALLVTDVELTGTFSPDASEIGAASVSGSVDFRQNLALLEELLGTTTSAEACAIVETFGVRCEPCADGVARCVSLVMEDLGGEWAEDVVLEERTEEAIAADPECGG
ncbi:MAG: Ig-like domain-containing protein [Alphaproteobacteria bacterium]|nr:Ig-like domain-containing protein [Alphaproteobacteria bacterium]